MKDESDLDDILDTVFEINPGQRPYDIRAWQLRNEIKQLVEFVKKEKPECILEIGTAKGGTLYIFSRYLDSMNTILSVDLPGGNVDFEKRYGFEYNGQKEKIFREFAPSKKMKFVRGSSQQDGSFTKVSEMTDNIDFLFIDGDHSYKGVKSDFEMYSKLVSEGGIIALHDIIDHPDNQYDVPQFWKKIKNDYETKEIISNEKQTSGGIGVIKYNT